jgi:hypothetical protein
VSFALPAACASPLRNRVVTECYSVRWNATNEHLAATTGFGRLQFWYAVPDLAMPCVLQGSESVM